jgi:Ricin-type beta-trefoil lectin domain-like
VNISGASYNNGTPIILWTCGNYANENFRTTYDSISNTPPGAYWWYSATSATSMVLNVSGAATGNGAQIILWDRGAYSNEYVRIY